MNYLVWALLLSTVTVVRAQDYVDECPEDNGFFADAVQCDRYYECKNGQVTLSQLVDLLNLVVFRRSETIHGRPGNFDQEKSDTSFLILLKITDNLCADGLVFDETSIQFAKCSFPFSVDCSDRPQLQKAKSSGVCPRKNGYFPHENPEVPIQYQLIINIKYYVLPYPLTTYVEITF